MKKLILPLITSLISPIKYAINPNYNIVYTFELTKTTIRLQSAIEYTYTSGNFNSLNTIGVNKNGESINLIGVNESNYTQSQSFLLSTNQTRYIDINVNVKNINDNWKILINDQEQKTTINGNTISIKNLDTNTRTTNIANEIKLVNDKTNEIYQNYNTYELNQSKLKAINVNANFSSYINNNYNYIKFTNDRFSINIHKNQKATIYYTDKYITLPILGTFLNNNEQYNILDFYILDENNNVVNLLETITIDKIISSAHRTNINDIYSGNCNSLNALFDNNTYADKYNYTYENNTITIKEGTPIGNASIIANDKEIDPFATSLFGINPLTKSYFGLNNRLYISQLVQSTLISSFTSQYVFWNYTQYMPIFSFQDTDTSKWNKTNTTTLNINLNNNYKIYLIAFPTDTNNDISVNVNDITTIIGAMDNLENIGLLPFTFGSIILIGVMLGFIMILIKILK